MPKVSRILLIIFPSAVFLLLLAAFIIKLPKTKTATVEVVPTPTAKVSPTPQMQNLTPLQTFTNNLNNLQINDPQLVRPNYDREISLPEEK